jgi:Ran GTPase-activating protein (RanGAP) involved in mRNA processing and transport
LQCRNKAGAQLAKVLATNKTITSLSLAKNGLGDPFMEALVAALATNTTLRILDLSGNKITAK